MYDRTGPPCERARGRGGGGNTPRPGRWVTVQSAGPGARQPPILRSTSTGERTPPRSTADDDRPTDTEHRAAFTVRRSLSLYITSSSADAADEGAAASYAETSLAHRRRQRVCVVSCTCLSCAPTSTRGIIRPIFFFLFRRPSVSTLHHGFDNIIIFIFIVIYVRIIPVR